MVLSTKADRGQNGFQVIEAAPSPWVTKVEHFFILPFLPSKTNEDQQHEISAHMVPEDTAEYRASGIGYIMILRYANTPVGPYDEIMFIPGAFNSPLLSSKSNQNSTITPLASISWIQAHPLIHDARIAQIYVSSEASLRNGRVQFGIPKELADFEWSKTSSRFSTTHSIAVKDRISGILFAQFEIRVSNIQVIPVSLSFLSGLFLPLLCHREINEDGIATEQSWLRIMLGGFMWAGFGRFQKKFSIESNQLFPNLDKLGILGVINLSGTAKFTTKQRISM